MRRVHVLAATLPLFTGLAACGQLLGEDFRLATDTATTTTHAGGSGGTTHAGGSGGTTSTGSTSTGSGGTTSTGSGGSGGTSTASTGGSDGGGAIDAGGPCADGVQGATETAVDCGGSCPPCVDGKTCKVPADCLGKTCNGQPAVCSGWLYYPSGVSLDVDPGALDGWTLCYEDSYQSFLQPHLADLKAKCSGSKILMACRAVSATKFQVAAAGPRADVFFPTGKGANATHSANGVAWYFDDAFSWGFTTDGNAVDRISCDFTDGADRVCWSTKPATAGYRCGDKKDLDIDAGVEFHRYVFHAP